MSVPSFVTSVSSGVSAIYAGRPAKHSCDLILVARNALPISAVSTSSGLISARATVALTALRSGAAGPFETAAERTAKPSRHLLTFGGHTSSIIALDDD
jgi:hypothetical protein